MIEIATATPWERPPKTGSSRCAMGRLAEEADPDRGHRDPDLAGGQVLVQAVELDDGLDAPDALARHRLESRSASAHERELSGHEQAVDEHQDE